MSLRPRFAGDGVLRLPERVSLKGGTGIPSAEIRGQLGDGTYDPFERVASGLLLAEDFARLEVLATPALIEWVEGHGVLDLARSLPSEAHATAAAPFAHAFADAFEDISTQQRNVAWHLLSIARLSDHLVPQPGHSEGLPWDPDWVLPVLAIGDGYVWRGAEGLAGQLLPGMASAAEPDVDPPEPFHEDDWNEWWAAGHASWQRIEAGGFPVVRAVSEVGEAPDHVQMALREMVGGDLTDGIGSGPWDLVELQRRLMAPYITRAGAHRAEVGWPDSDEWDVPWHPPLVVYERRTWDSLLAPVYVQLLEGLRRVTEGLRGAAFCKECGQPFLTLDARRSAFCTDRERYRFGQREHRRRIARQAEHYEELEGIDLDVGLDDPGSDEA